MSEHAPQQLFDGSFFEAILQTPALKTAPPAPVLPPFTLDEELPEFQTFDWDAYNREFFERIPDSAKKTVQGREMAHIAGTQIWMSRQFPAPILNFLLLNAPVKALWQYLGAKERKADLAFATRGFQHTPAILRQPVVRSRLLQWLQKNPAEIYLLLMIWGLATPPPPAAIATQGESDEALVRQKLPGWVRKFGLEATIAGLAIAAKPRTLATLLGWLQDPAELRRLIEACPEEAPPLAPETALATAPPSDEEAHAPDSEAAHFWKAQCEIARANDARRSGMLEKTLDASERFMAQISAQKLEIEALKTREKVVAQSLEKKLAAAQKRLKTELDELKKSFERQTRKLRALERDHETLETENRRFKKQLRHAGTLLEEERRRASALELKGAPASESVEALSTPQVQQSAPGKVVKVGAPTPLDEIFQWRADGRLVRITAREVRRLIDKNDEEGVYAVVQALESLQLSPRPDDQSLHGKIRKRIGDAGPYYARVLAENMARVLVDASNVARYAPNKYGKGQLRHLIEMREELRRLGCFPIIFIADASLRYFIDESKKFHEMVASGEIEVVDKGVEADEILAREARRTGAYVVTNDAKFFHKVSPDFEPPRVTFRIYDGTVIVDEF